MQPTPELAKIIQNSCFAVQHEVTSESRPVSAVRNPDGSQQGETITEFHARIVTTAIMYAIETGQLTVPENIHDVLGSWNGIPIQRDNRDGIHGLRLPDGSYT